jgi:hypothetical protein
MNDELTLKIQAWVDGELSGWQSRRIAKLVESDADAKALATELRQTKAAMSGNEMNVVVPDVRQFYWNQIRLEIERQSATQQRASEPVVRFDPLGWLSRIGLPMAGVAVAACVALLTFVQFSRPAYEDVSAVSDEMNSVTFHDQNMTITWLQDDQAIQDDQVDQIDGSDA